MITDGLECCGFIILTAPIHCRASIATNMFPSSLRVKYSFSKCHFCPIFQNVFAMADSVCFILRYVPDDAMSCIVACVKHYSLLLLRAVQFWRSPWQLFPMYMTSIQPFLFVNTCCYVCLLHTLNAFCIYCFSVLSVHVRDKDGGGCMLYWSVFRRCFGRLLAFCIIHAVSKLAKAVTNWKWNNNDWSYRTLIAASVAVT